MSRGKVAPRLTEYARKPFRLAPEARAELKALLAVAKASEPLLQHAQEWFSSEYLDHPATLRLSAALARLRKLSNR